MRVDLLVLVCFAWMLVILHAAVLPRRKAEARHGHVRSLGDPPKKVTGGFEFQESLDVEIEVENKVKKTVKLTKQNIPNVGGIGVDTSTVYAADDVTLRQECRITDEAPECQVYALVKAEGETTYINNNGQALVLENKNGELISQAPDKRHIRSIDNRGDGSTSHHGEQKKKRALSDDLASTSVMKVIMFADKGLLDIFLDLNNNDEIAAKDDIRKYFTLVTNEMTVYYQTLRDYGLPMTVNGVQTTMDLAVALVRVEFPSTESPSGNFDFSETNRDGNKIFDTETQQPDNTYVKGGVLVDFRGFLKSQYSTNTTFDAAILVTGYDFNRFYTYQSGSTSTVNILGLAYNGVMCNAIHTGNGYHSAVVEIDGASSRLFSHESGHWFSMVHDGEAGDSTNCPENTFLMSSLRFYPTLSTSDTYTKYSVCSAKSLQTYTAGLSTANFIDSCLQTPDDAFWTKFCQGFTGTDELLFTFDDQCKLEHGLASKRTTDSNPTKENNLLDGYVESCISNDDYSNYPFRCKNPSTSSSSYIQTTAATGTKCLAPDGSQNPDYVCFHGQCVNSVTICSGSSSTVPTTAAPTTTTAAPTTTAPITTTAAPITTTAAPTTTTAAPTTTTAAPTTTTAAPTTAAPTTTTAAPTTTTAVQTTASPETCTCGDNTCCKNTRNADGTCCTGCIIKGKGCSYGSTSGGGGGGGGGGKGNKKGR